MNFFRRAAPPTVKEPPSSPPPATARLEKERKWISTVSKQKQGGSQSQQPSEEGSRRREPSANGNGNGSTENGDGNRFGKWLNSTNERQPESSQASIKSKKSFFGTRSTPAPTASTHQARSVPSSASSPASTMNPAFSPSFSPTLSSHTETVSRSTSPNPEAKSLATRLQELAIANADGLLDDDEYRILRQQVFETHSSRSRSNKQIGTSVVKLSEGTVAVPKLNGSATNSASYSRPQSPFFGTNGLSTPPNQDTETLASPLSSPRRAPSVTSHQSNKRNSILPPLSNLFRRETSSSTNSDGDWDVVTPPLPSPNDHPRSLSPLPHFSDNRSVLSGRSNRNGLSPPSSPVRNRSIRNHPGLASSAMDPRSSSYFAGSSRSSNGRSYAGGEGESILSGGGRSTSHAPRSPTSVRTRSYYGGGGGPSSALSHGYSSNHSHDRGSGVETLLSHSLPPITSSTDPLLFAATGREPTVQELEREIREIEAEWERMRESWREIVRGRIEKWESQVGPALVERVRGAARTEVQSSTETKGNGMLPVQSTGAKRGLFRRASFLAPTQAVTNPTATTPTNPTLPQYLLSPNSPLPVEFETSLSPHELEPTLSLRTAMGEVLERQRRTEENYQRRIDFLRAKETGAKIRQGLFK